MGTRAIKILFEKLVVVGAPGPANGVPGNDNTPKAYSDSRSASQVLWRVDEWRCELWNHAPSSHVRLYMGGALVFDREILGDARRIANVAHGLETIVTAGMPSRSSDRWPLDQ